MKSTTTTNSILTKTCLLALVLPAVSHAQTHYDWTIKDDVASWGDSSSIKTGGSYTRDYVLWSGSHTGNSWSAHPSEGPYDGRSGLMHYQTSTGIMTRTDPNAIFNLSAVGSSATIRTAYHYQAVYPDTGGNAHMYQFGLTNNANYFGKTGDESLLVAANYQNQDWPTRTATYNLELFDHTGLDTTGDGSWDTTPITTLAEDLLVGSWAKSHAIELTYTNIGNGQLKLDIGVMNLDISGRYASDTMTSYNQIASKSVIVDHNFSDLSALRPGFGAVFNDSDNPNSGAAFDWEAAYPTGFSQVPEPSSTSLLGLGIAGFLLRRKRK